MSRNGKCATVWFGVLTRFRVRLPTTYTNPPISQPTVRIDDSHAFTHPRHLRLPRCRRQSHALDRHHHWPHGNALFGSHPQALVLIPAKLPLLATHRPLQDTHLPSQHRLQRPHLSGHPERQVECSLQRAERVTEPPESAGGAEQVSLRQDTALLIQAFWDWLRKGMLTLITLSSASPLNNEAAQLHEKDPEEYQRKVLSRHQDIDD